ncbi:hypothetical protein [Acidovorax radicis]|uniref:hypothetical protein n=1 Tax=Acidovorax radicis TaxID=758826 RepID=UPI001CFAB18F|nr:hypothetical protein [Acidovorax radicis]UCV00954.1 hypothetical protein KI609_09565 [Acidovorax radicis]
MTIAAKVRFMAAPSTLVQVARSGYLLAEEHLTGRHGRQVPIRQTVGVAHTILQWTQKLGADGPQTHEQAVAPSQSVSRFRLA